MAQIILGSPISISFSLEQSPKPTFAQIYSGFFGQMSTQSINRPHCKTISQLSRLFLDDFAQENTVGFIGFGRSPTAGAGRQFFNPILPPTVDPSVDRRNADRFHFRNLLQFMSQMKEANGCTPLPYFRSFIAPDGCFNSLYFCFVELIISGFWHAPSLSYMPGC